MTKTKSQKMRSRARNIQSVAASGRRSRITRKRNNRVRMREGDILSGNSVSLFNTSAFGSGKGRLGRQSRKRVFAPVASGYAGLSAKALITTLGSGVTRVRHSEYIADIVPSEDFDIETFSINPGTDAIFPWLSSIAKRYESYQFRALCFRYETQAPTSATGTVLLSVDYNPGGLVPSSKVEMLAMESAVRASVWDSVENRSLAHNLTKRKSYYVRNGDSVSDPDLFDTGTFLLAVEGSSDTSGRIGELFVDYEVDLLTPVLNNSAVATGSVTGTTIVNPTNGAFPLEANIEYVNTADMMRVGPGINVLSGASTIGAIQFLQQGNYLLNFTFTTDSPDSTPFTDNNFVFGSRSSFVGTVTNLTPGGEAVMTNATGTIAVGTYAIEVDQIAAPSAVIGMFGVATGDTVSDGDTVTCVVELSLFNPTNSRPGLRSGNLFARPRTRKSQLPSSSSLTLKSINNQVLSNLKIPVRPKIDHTKRRETAPSPYCPPLVDIDGPDSVKESHPLYMTEKDISSVIERFIALKCSGTIALHQ